MAIPLPPLSFSSGIGGGDYTPQANATGTSYWNVQTGGSAQSLLIVAALLVGAVWLLKRK